MSNGRGAAGVCCSSPSSAERHRLSRFALAVADKLEMAIQLCSPPDISSINFVAHAL
jgi:hypothetical protein